MLRLIAIELILFCALFTMMVKTAVWNSALNGLYFYPEPVQERAFDIGLTDRDAVARKRRRFMLPFFLVHPVSECGICEETWPSSCPAPALQQ